eukprot:TRINITY_DN909_c0_g1_i1.p1 TRINITY_DN909_c0_g1~~TRINITY_DN909_c0_g1_i1.p1  ORF type:complete len:1312 (+),score=310.70 TRINITY_DN909_c0_g1_i1:295-3936(+)
MGDTLFQDAVQMRQGSDFKPFSGRLSRTGVFTIEKKGGKLVHSLTIVKGTTFDGPTKSSGKWVLWIRIPKSRAFEIATIEESLGLEWKSQFEKYLSPYRAGSTLNAVDESPTLQRDVAAKREHRKSAGPVAIPSFMKVKVGKNRSPLKMFGGGSKDFANAAPAADAPDDGSAAPSAAASARVDRASRAFEGNGIEMSALELLRFNASALSPLELEIPSYMGFKQMSPIPRVADYHSDEETSSDESEEERLGLQSAETDEDSGPLTPKSKQRLSRRSRMFKRNATTFKKNQEGEDEERELKRKYIAMEILSTEESYVDSLARVGSAYMDPWMKAAEELECDKADVRAVFGNIKLLSGFNKKLCGEIKKIVEEWDASSCMGPVFVKFAPFLKMYTEYSNKYEAAMALFHEMYDGSEELRDFLNECKVKSGSGHFIPDLLIMPVQRIPRYSLLLSDLVSKTPGDHPDNALLKAALAKVEEVARHVNEEVRRSENQRRVEEFQDKGAQLGSLIKPHRYMVKEAMVKVTVSLTAAGQLLKPDFKSVRETHQFILFNDLFVHVKKESLKSESDLSLSEFSWPLLLCWITKGNDGVVQIRNPTKILSFPDHDDWYESLKTCITDHVLQASDHKDSSLVSLRNCEHTYPNGHGSYIGDWNDGIREGVGSLMVQNNLFKGCWRRDVFHGRGQMIYAAGDVFHGTWVDGLQDGPGRIVKSDGTQITASYHRGKRTGLGMIEYSNGDVFVGTFAEDHIHGEGRLQQKSGLVYEGNFRHGRFDGVGKLTLPNGTTYVGEFHGGSRHGKGTLQMFSGAIYKGSFENDKRHGLGVSVEIDGSQYSGSWVNDLPHGEGDKIYAGGLDAQVYSGEWHNGIRHGRGKLRSSDGSLYDGQFRNDLPNGEGLFVSDGYIYKGTYFNGLKEGKGTAIYPDGAKYTGSFLCDQFHKSGTWLGGDGAWVVSYDGDFEHGSFEGKGSIVFLNGDTYKGSFRGGMLHGEGDYIHSNGFVEKGKWDFGVHRSAKNLTVILPGEQRSLHGVMMNNSLHRNSGFSINIPLPMPSVQLGTSAWLSHAAPRPLKRDKKKTKAAAKVKRKSSTKFTEGHGPSNISLGIKMSAAGEKEKEKSKSTSSNRKSGDRKPNLDKEKAEKKEKEREKEKEKEDKEKDKNVDKGKTDKSRPTTKGTAKTRPEKYKTAGRKDKKKLETGRVRAASDLPKPTTDRSHRDGKK